jgi:cytochrome P450
MEWSDFLGDSIFTTDGQQWHNSRQLIRPMFVREKVADLPLVETHVRRLISLCGSGDGTAVRLDKLFFRFSLDASTHFLFGKSVGSLEREQSEFAAAFDEVQRVQTLEGRLGYVLTADAAANVLTSPVLGLSNASKARNPFMQV